MICSRMKDKHVVEQQVNHKVLEHTFCHVESLSSLDAVLKIISDAQHETLVL